MSTFSTSAKYLSALPISLFFGLFSLVSADLARADEVTFRNERYGFSVRYPAEKLDPVEVKTPGVGLALRARTSQEGRGQFPTVTFTIEPKRLKDPSDLELHANDVLSSYRKIGITSVARTSTRALTLSQGSAVQVLLSYSQGGELYASSVTLIPGKDYTYVITFIDFEKSYHDSAALESAIIKSFTMQELAPPPEIPYPERNRWLVLYSSLFMLIALGGTIAWVRKRRTH